MLAFAIKSTIYLSTMYVPYMLMLRNESFFRFNRVLLLCIILLSIILPFCDFHALAIEANPIHQGMIEIGMPIAIVEGQVQSPHHASNYIDWQLIIAYAYILGVIVTAMVKLYQLATMYFTIHKGVLWKDDIDGAVIYCHANDVVPFSWFNSIVISEQDYRQNAVEIIGHEMGHIRHHHSWDICLVNIVEVIQWMNPLVWILASSLRNVHEYEADDAVLRSGVNARQYQTLLIRKAVGSSSYTFANSFNHSQLKKRFTMMFRKESNPWMRTKGLYIIPVAVIALSAFATPELNNKVDNLVQQNGSVDKVNQNPANLQNINGENANSFVNGILGDVVESDNDRSKQIENTDTINVNEADDFGPNMVYVIDHVETTYEAAKSLMVEDVSHIEVLRDEETLAALSRGGKHDKKGIIMITTKAAEASKDKDVFDVVENMPEFPGGMQEMVQYLSSSIRYPKVAFDNGVSARVIVQFIVEKDGSISNVKTINFQKLEAKKPASEDNSSEEWVQAVKTGSDEATLAATITSELTTEAQRVVASMPKWTPGTQNGKAVRVKYVIPISFRLT